MPLASVEPLLGPCRGAAVPGFLLRPAAVVPVCTLRAPSVGRMLQAVLTAPCAEDSKLSAHMAGKPLGGSPLWDVCWGLLVSMLFEPLPLCLTSTLEIAWLPWVLPEQLAEAAASGLKVYRGHCAPAWPR